MGPPAEQGPAYATRSGNHNSAITALMSAHACRVCIGCKDCTAEWQSARFCQFKMRWLTGSGKRQASNNPSFLARDARVIEASSRAMLHLQQTFLQAQAQIGWPGVTLAQDRAAWIGKAAAASRATSVYAQQQQAC
jgi:hypothetical protein